MTYLPIAEHGLIGDLRTCALVGTDGTIDWFCARRFDAPSVFGAILDADKGGSWQIGPTHEVLRSQQFYLPDTNVLVTRFLTAEGVTEVNDLMPILAKADADHRQRLVRKVTAVRGDIDLTTRIAARPDYGRADVRPRALKDRQVLLADGEVDLVLSANVDLEIDGDDVVATTHVKSGESVVFVLEVLEHGEEPVEEELDVEGLVDRTVQFWRDWLAQSVYTGRWRETVHRSALTLKLMCHEPTGGIVAAPTTSLPEHVGGERNWDYRYVWVRDAAFSVYALLRLGFLDEAADFMAWLVRRLDESRDDPKDSDEGPLRVMYDLDGEVPRETELGHLSGYRDSTPVRVGNAAVDQLQLDIYGELIDSAYLFDKYGEGLSHDTWGDLCRIIDWLAENWQRTDAGMWEVRNEPQAHTSSRMMCWVAFERMMRIARRRGLPADLTQLAKVRDAVYDRLMTKSWDAEEKTFTQVEGGDVLDAGILLMPMLKLLAPNDPRFLATLASIEERLVSDTLVFRYDYEQSADGVGGEEGTFSLCSFWYVEALTRVGRLDDARLALEKMFTYANHLGLYAEQIGRNGDQLGNFPQAFTHLGLISAAINLDLALG